MDFTSFSILDWCLLGLGFASPVVGYIVYRVYMRRKRTYSYEKVQKRTQLYERLYKILIQIPLVRNYIFRITKKYSKLSVYKQSEIKELSVKSLIKLIYFSVGIFVLSCFVFDDIITIAITTIAAYVLEEISVERRIEKSTVLVYKQLKLFISSLRIETKKSKGDIIIALENATCGSMLTPIISNLKQLLVSPSGEQALEEFYETVPFKQLQTLAMICFHINNNGDEINSQGDSVLDDTLLLMNNDINLKLEELNYEAMLYKLNLPLPFAKQLEALTFLGPIVGIGSKYYLSYIMPATAILFNGIFGLMLQSAIIISSIFAYKKVAKAHLKALISTDDIPGYVKKIMSFKGMNFFFRSLTPKKRQKRQLLRFKLKQSFSKRKLEDFYCQKFIFALLGFVITTLLTLFAPNIQYRYLNENIYELNFFSDTSLYEDKKGNVLYQPEDVLIMDDEYIKRRNSGEWILQDDTDKQEIKEFVKEYLPKLSKSKYDTQVSRLEDKYQHLNDVKYHWWYIIFAFGVAVFTWRIPNKQLKERLIQAKSEEEEEFLQLQMVTMILASMNCDTLDTLTHLAKISDFHKDSLAYCCYSYASNPEKALEEMEENVTSENFKIFIGKLKDTIEYLSVKEVFADLQSDRTHIATERDLYIKDTITRTRNKMAKKALAPMKYAIYGMMVFPIIYVAATSLSNTLDAISTL